MTLPCRVRGCLIAMLLAFAPCTAVWAQSTEDWPPPPDGAVQLPEAEIEALVTGNSWLYPYGDGGVHFDPKGDANTEWRGERDLGWWHMDDGEICIDVRSWGGPWCYIFYRVDDVVMTYGKTYGRFIEVPIEPGKLF